jgi:hypothetical protein
MKAAPVRGFLRDVLTAGPVLKANCGRYLRFSEPVARFHPLAHGPIYLCNVHSFIAGRQALAVSALNTSVTSMPQNTHGVMMGIAGAPDILLRSLV